VSAPEPSPAQPSVGGEICVRFWASARAAAGAAAVTVQVPGEIALDELVDQLLRDLRHRPDLGRVLGVCSVLVGDRPAGAADRASVVVRPGTTVEFLPPFAGG
jgi:molybdopterin synthase sulfur carrier subunit